MLHVQTAHRWSAEPGFVQALRRWTWCRRAWPELMQHLTGADGHAQAAVDREALARAFWAWASSFDEHAALEALDPVDYAHYQTGMLLSQWLIERPLRATVDDRSQEVRWMTETALTLLSAWRQAVGAPPLDDVLRDVAAARWSSYVENVFEDATVAVAFLDLFTGCEPVWSYPSMPGERPPLRRALAQRRALN